ncbi:hypothetical protein GW17_00035664 [Ensete ventricosum]|nr:hypothetical protein GW17_00035664 [Ensete ventricosum]
MGWAGFNGGDPYAANIDSSLAVLNTNICAATSLLVWTCLDTIFFKKPSVIGAVQGMITGLVVGAMFIIGWNVVMTTLICVAIRYMMPLRMSEEQLAIGDDAVHGEEAYALWGDGEKYDSTKHGVHDDETLHKKVATGVTEDV